MSSPAYCTAETPLIGLIFFVPSSVVTPSLQSLFTCSPAARIAWDNDAEVLWLQSTIGGFAPGNTAFLFLTQVTALCTSEQPSSTSRISAFSGLVPPQSIRACSIRRNL